MTWADRHDALGRAPMPSHCLPAGLSPPGVVVVAGPFGSGKTEIAVNLARRWAEAIPTYLADLDVVTPYFRPRDIAQSLATVGVRVLAPGGAAGAFDGPVLPREMAAAIGDTDSGLIIDVGGQPQGAGVLAHWREALQARGAKLCLVVNPRRPAGGNLGALAELARAIVERAGLPIAGIIANGNLGTRTTVADVIEGLRKARELAELLVVPVPVVCCPVELTEECLVHVGDVPVFGLTLSMRPPWEGSGLSSWVGRCRSGFSRDP